ncbi:hypothetical protein JYK02_23635 [Corallococcus macrosporus]|uniref:Uncharacterized protein n=1 Tax=Corallococcus macrosporus TaxID=35 RepID=A0ABS3DGR3_9BACT|nr:hypothetical protein [Corallococcus macrosporus]MBN8230509.1 hypothetical protein [Corallococcus macrosporus]
MGQVTQALDKLQTGALAKTVEDASQAVRSLAVRAHDGQSGFDRPTPAGNSNRAHQTAAPSNNRASTQADYSYGTRTRPNPRATDPSAGIPLKSLNFSRDTNRIITAIEKHESNNNQGENPATLRNASGTPASFGRGQLIGSTAVGLLQSSPALAQHYNLSSKQLQDLNKIAADTQQHFDSISKQVPPGGLSEKDLKQKIATYTANNRARFVQETGLPASDIERMFRGAQLRAQMPRTALRGSRSEIEAQALKTVNNLMAQPDFAANISALGLQRGDLKAYVKVPNRHGEHRAGFATRALFNSRDGQTLRNAMTDNSGIAMSRILINQNATRVNQRAREQLHRPLTFPESAEVTMLVHNRGERDLSKFLGALNQRGRTQDSYVREAMRHLPQ